MERKMAGKGWKVLLIDDDPGIRKVMGITLDDAGYEVQTASDGESGVEVCGQFLPDIVITDVRLPGIDGIEVLRRVKAGFPEVEVIVATAFSEIGLAIQALHLDASDFITKPIGDDALTVALKRAKERIATRKELKDYTALIEERWMQTAEELAKTFDMQKSLIESSIDGIAACDGDGKVMIFNKSMEKMLRYSKQEVLGSIPLDRFFAAGEAAKFHDKLLSEEYGGSKRLFLYETVLEDRSGIRIPCQVSATVMVQGGDEIGTVVFFRDQREIRKLMQQVADQARFLQQDKMISLGKLAASVVHEINNPLTGILNFTKLMSRMLTKGALVPESVAKFQGYLTLMDSELSRCCQIVANLLAFSRKSKLEFGEVKVNDLLSKSLILSEHKLALQNIRCETILDPNDPVVTGDFNQLQQCVINLIFNAIDAMPDGGTLTIESFFEPIKDVVGIRVRDTGCGISKEDLIYIFDPFFSTKKEGKGLGMGLSTSYGIVARHLGTISVDTEEGIGTSFTIHLPVRPPAGALEKTPAG